MITLKRILQAERPIRYVSHDLDDGGWQFLDGGDLHEEDAMVVGLGEIVRFDPTVRELADLPLAWYAWLTQLVSCGNDGNAKAQAADNRSQIERTCGHDRHAIS